MPSSNPIDQYRLQLNTIEQDRHAEFAFEHEFLGLNHEGEWVSKVTVIQISEKLAKKIPIGTSFQGKGTTKKAATEVASEAMVALFRTKDVQPKTGRTSTA